MGDLAILANYYKSCHRIIHNSCLIGTIIPLNGTIARASAQLESLAFQHELHELVMDVPVRGLADTELTTQHKRGYPGFRLADQVNGQKQKGQRQIHSLKKCSGNQQSLITTMAALKGLARAAFQNTMPGSATPGVVKSVWPTRRFQGCCALFFGANRCRKHKF